MKFYDDDIMILSKDMEDRLENLEPEVRKTVLSLLKNQVEHAKLEIIEEYNSKFMPNCS